MKNYTVINPYMAEWMESWDLEAMTSYNREIRVRGPVGTSWGFFTRGSHPRFFSTSRKCSSGFKYKLFQILKFVRPGVWPDVRTSIPTPSCWCNLKKAQSLVLLGGFLPM